MYAIETDGLQKRYGRSRGIEDVSLAVRSGEIFGFLGPNGAGKTTTIRTLLGFLLPTGGTARVLGLDIGSASLAIRRRTGYLPSEANLYPHMRGREILDFALASRGRRDAGRVRELADRLEIDLSRRIKQCSRGMRQKVAIIAALAHDPDLVILDEPTTGLDPLVQRTFADLMREEAGRGKTVFISSHNLAEAEALCQRVAIIREGRVVTVDDVDDLRRMRIKRVAMRLSGDPPDLAGVPGVRTVQANGGWLNLQVAGDLRPLLAVLAAAPLQDLRIEDPSLEEVFLEYYSSRAGGDRA